MNTNTNNGFQNYVLSSIQRINSLLIDMSGFINTILFEPLTMAGPLIITDTTDSSCDASGALTIPSGGMSIGKSLTVGINACITGKVLNSSGTDVAPSLTFTSDTKTGFYLKDPDTDPNTIGVALNSLNSISMSPALLDINTSGTVINSLNISLGGRTLVGDKSYYNDIQVQLTATQTSVGSTVLSSVTDIVSVDTTGGVSTLTLPSSAIIISQMGSSLQTGYT